MTHSKRIAAPTVLIIAIVACFAVSISSGQEAPGENRGGNASDAPARTLDELDTQIEQLKASIVEDARSQEPSEESLWWSTRNAMTISSVTLGFGVIIFLLATYLIVHAGKSAEEVLRVFATILIIVSALFLVVAGYTERQISPVMGLLGTIVGYLLGKGASGSSEKPEEK
jgi:hypothetical protein